MKTLRFYRDLPDGARYLLGAATLANDGWRFVPNVAGRKSSRKAHASMEKCLPRWLNYPDGCSSERAPEATA